MSIQPEGENLRKAVKWISEERKYNPERSLKELIEAASLNFDLSPGDEEFLFRFEQEDNV